MTRADETELTARLVECRNLLDSAQKCLAHVHYTSPNPVSAKKFTRTPADVGRWLREFDRAAERLWTLRARLSELDG